MNVLEHEMKEDDPKLRDIQSRLQNNWQRVLFRLWVAKLFEQRFWLAPGIDTSIIRGWLPIYAVTEPMIGGSAGDVRLRDCRKHGIPFKQTVINGKSVPYKIHEWTLYGKEKKTYIYRLACNLTPEDWEEIFERKYIYYKPPVPTLRDPPAEPERVVIGKYNQICLFA